MSSRPKRSRAPRPSTRKNRAPTISEVDDRPEVTALFANLKAARKPLSALLLKHSGEWTYFDPVYRYYHQSFKVFGLQAGTASPSSSNTTSGGTK